MSQMPLLSRKAPPPDPWPHLRVLWAVAILGLCVLLQTLVLFMARRSLGKNESVIVSLALGLILPTVAIVAQASPNPRQTLRLNGLSLCSACWVIGASLCFTLLITSSIELAFRTGALPSKIHVLLEEEERLLVKTFSFESARDLFTMTLAVVAIAPIAEELLFRGLLQGSLERRLGN